MPIFKRAGSIGSKERTIAAEGDQREVSRIPPALDCNGSHRARNAGAADKIGAVGRLLQRHTKGERYLRRNRALCLERIEPQPAL